MNMNKEEKSFLKECEDHVYFCRNMNNHAWTNILITRLLGMVKTNQDNYDKLLIKYQIQPTKTADG